MDRIACWPAAEDCCAPAAALAAAIAAGLLTPPDLPPRLRASTLPTDPSSASRLTPTSRRLRSNDLRMARDGRLANFERSWGHSQFQRHATPRIDRDGCCVPAETPEPGRPPPNFYESFMSFPHGMIARVGRLQPSSTSPPGSVRRRMPNASSIWASASSGTIDLKRPSTGLLARLRLSSRRCAPGDSGSVRRSRRRAASCQRSSDRAARPRQWQDRSTLPSRSPRGDS